MNYWIFKCNPTAYLLDDRRRDKEEKITWRVTRYNSEIQAGDLAFIWKTGKDRGICAVMQIESDPKEMPDYEHEDGYKIVLDNNLKVRVEGKIIRWVECISAYTLKSIDGLQNLSVFSGYQQTTNFRVTQEEGLILMKLIQDQG